MKAMIFAAGLGTRLKPLTENIPKALVEVNSVPLLEIQINKLISYGFNQIIINVHHFSGKVIDFLKSKTFNADIVISDESVELLDTGGGLVKASWFFNDDKPFLVYNVDVISDIDLGRFYQNHINNKYLASLAVRDRQTSRYFLFNELNLLCGWKNTKSNEKIITQDSITSNRFAFSGIHIIDPKIFSLIKEKNKFSITNTYIELSKNNDIFGYRHDADIWFDLGNIENLKKANEFYKDRKLF
jgi:NDP-sugar pyrophosphorylase family protein